MRGLVSVLLAACGSVGQRAVDATPGPEPRLDVAVDKPTVMTELGTMTPLTVTLTAANGFGGQVTVMPSIVDANGAPLTAWTITASQLVTVPQDGTQMVVLMLAIPTENKGLAGTVQIATTSTATAGTHAATTAVTVLDQVSLAITSNAGGCVYPNGSTPVRITEGTKVRFVDAGTINMIIHSDGGTYGVAHQNVTAPIAPGASYDQTVQNADGGSFTWYCHAPGPDLGPNDPAILVVKP